MAKCFNCVALCVCNPTIASGDERCEVFHAKLAHQANALAVLAQCHPKEEKAAVNGQWGPCATCLFKPCVSDGCRKHLEAVDFKRCWVEGNPK